MVKKTLLLVLFVTLVGLNSQAKADWVMDFGPGLSGGVTNFEILEGPTFTGAISPNHTSGHEWSLNPASADPFQINIRYEFPSLSNEIWDAGIVPTDRIRFSVPLASTSPEGTFSVVGTAERASGAEYTFTNDSGGTPSDPNGNFEWRTTLTGADLAVDDIIALNFEVTYVGTGGIGIPGTFTFGGPGGLIAAPEPTSAAMIGCALVGLIARRRRKA